VASDAEIDLLVNASNALRDLERDLDRLINQAEASADPVLIAATLDRTLALRNMRRDLDEAVRVAQAGAPDIHVRADVDIDDDDVGRVNNFKVGLLTLGTVAGRSLGPLAGLAGGLAKAGAAAGSAAPLLAGVVVAVESILPAAALATSGLLTLKLATTTVQIAMIGVQDAIKTAFDPDASPEDLAKAMEKLGPHARSFVKELAGMRKGFKAVQIDVQNRLFANFDTSLERLGKSVLPSLHGALDRTADSLNDMGRGAAEAGAQLGDSGILGSALASSTGALSKLERVPGQVITAFGQLAAASGPALEGLATRAGGVADRIAEKLSKAFESGALEKAINVAISNIDQLGRVAGNIFSGIGNILKAVTVDGQGLFGTLEKVSQAFEDLTASEEFQSALKALSQTMGVLVTTALPLLSDAFKALLPVIEILAPPIQQLIKDLGTALGPIIEELGPVLESLATAFGKLIPALTPIVELAGRLIVAILPSLTKLFEFLGEVFERLAPIVEQLAENIAGQLEPVLAKIPEILDQVLPKFLELADKLLPLLLDILVEIGPELGELGTAFADLLVELTPLLVKFLEFQIFLIEKMLPIIGPIASAIATILGSALMALTEIIREFVIPIVRGIVALLEGDWTEAMRQAAVVVNNLRDNVSRAFDNLKARAVQAITGMGAQIIGRIIGVKDSFLSTIQSLVNQAVARMAELPVRILSVMSGLGSLLFHIGQDIIQGLINGVTSKIGELVGKLKEITSLIPKVKGPLDVDRVLLTPAGEEIMGGLIRGLQSQLPALRKELTGITMMIPQSVAQPVQGLSPGATGLRSPVVNVFIGADRLDQRIDFRVSHVNGIDTRRLAHGVRR